MGSAIILGLEEVEKRQILPGYSLEWVMRNTKCKPRTGITEAVDLWKSVTDLDVIIGKHNYFSFVDLIFVIARCMLNC